MTTKLPKPTKLPKQWRHWAAAARLKPHDRCAARSRDWYYLRGRGRHWRVNCHGQFECGDTYAEFDRWALCDIRRLPLPLTKAGFVISVKALLAARAEACRHECLGQDVAIGGMR